MTGNVSYPMVLTRSLGWLGFVKPAPVAGLHLSSDLLTLVALRADERSDAVRIEAVGRRALAPGVHAGGEIRLIEPVAAALEGLVAQLRIPAGTPVAVALEPVASALAVSDQWTVDEESQEVSAVNHEAVVDLIVRSDLELARLGRRLGYGEVALRSSTGWAVVTEPGRVTAGRIQPSRTPGLEIGAAVDVTAPLGQLTGIDVPRGLRPLVDPGTDGVAIGAALGVLGRPPLANVGPSPRSTATDWAAQPVHLDERDDLDGSHDRDIAPEPGTAAGEGGADGNVDADPSMVQRPAPPTFPARSPGSYVAR